MMLGTITRVSPTFPRALTQNFATSPTSIVELPEGGLTLNRYKLADLRLKVTAMTGTSQEVRVALVEHHLDLTTDANRYVPIPVTVTTVAGTGVQIEPNGQTAVSLAVNEQSQNVAEAILTSATDYVVLRATRPITGAIYLRVTGAVSPGTVAYSYSYTIGVDGV